MDHRLIVTGPQGLQEADMECRCQPQSDDMTAAVLCFEQLRHYVGREVLEFYDMMNSWDWYYLTDRNVTLAELVWAFDRRKRFLIEMLMQDGTLTICKTLRDIPGRDFYCIYYEERAFFIEPCKVTKGKE